MKLSLLLFVSFAVSIQGATNFCAGKPNGSFCNSNVLTTCRSGRVSATSTCTSQCVITSSTSAQCTSATPTASSFCVGKANGNYCISSSQFVSCSNGVSASTTTCTATPDTFVACYDASAVDVLQNGVSGTGGAASCYVSTYSNDLSHCVDQTSSWCENDLVGVCILTGQSYLKPVGFNKHCLHRQTVSLATDLDGTKSCTGKATGYHCPALGVKVYYCPGSSGTLEQTLPSAAIPTQCLALWAIGSDVSTCTPTMVSGFASATCGL